MKKRKICIVITTRGNYAKMKSVIKHINEHPALELQLIVAGGAILPKYGNIATSVVNLNVNIDRNIHYLVEGENPIAMAKSSGLALIEFSTAFENMRPDIVIVIADRYECLPIAIAASYMNIVVAHVEGGELSGSIDESVRHAITKLSHIHFPSTEKAAEVIGKLGEDPNKVFNVGSSSLDVIADLDLNNLNELEKVQEKIGVGSPVDLKGQYLVVIQHPVTTEYENNLHNINETIKAITTLKMNTVWLWPNMDAGSDGISKGIRIFREFVNPEYVHFFKSLPIEHYAPLLYNASCIVGNSSSGIRESAYMGVPCVNIGSRQDNRERSENVIDVDYDHEAILKAIRTQLQVGRYKPNFMYGKGNAGEQIARVLAEIELSTRKELHYI